jgi:hypothetical protein
MHVIASKVRCRNRQLAEFPTLKLLGFFKLKVLDIILQVCELRSQDVMSFFQPFPGWQAEHHTECLMMSPH